MKAIFTLVGLALLIGCNPVKQVMRDPGKVQQVVNKYLDQYIVKSDTIVKMLPGDTITTVVTHYDTAIVETIDTVTQVKIRDRIVNRERVEYKTRVDTFKVTIRDNRLADDLNKKVIAANATIDYLKSQPCRWWLWLLIGMVAGVLVVFLVKVIR